MYVTHKRTHTKIGLKEKEKAILKLYATPMEAYIDSLNFGPFGET